MLKELQSGVILVNFTKVNGEKRNMKCTLHKDFMPKYEDREEKTRTIDLNQVRVWDVDAQGWRSFRLDSVNHIFNPAPANTPQAQNEPKYISMADILRS